MKKTLTNVMLSAAKNLKRVPDHDGTREMLSAAKHDMSGPGLYGMLSAAKHDMTIRYIFAGAARHCI